MAGWIKLHREIRESKTFQKLTAIQKLIAIYVVLNANHKDGVWYDNYKGTEVEVKRGQLITSRKKIVEEWFNGDKDVTEQKVRTALTKLSNLGFLTIESTNWYSFITVVKYEVYQGSDEDAEMSDQSLTKVNFSESEKSTSKSTSGEGIENLVVSRGLAVIEPEVNQLSNQLLTSTQPAPNQHLTTNKNVKNVKNEKEDIKPSSSRNKKSAYSEDDRYYKMAVYFYEKVMNHAATNNIAHLIENADMQKWADEFRKIVELDKREPEEIGEVVNWCTADSFWQVNILSPAKLRKQYVQLAVKSKVKPIQTGSLSKASKNKNLLQEVRNESSGSVEPVRSIYGSLPFSGIE